jgi:hypothetical protein
MSSVSVVIPCYRYGHFLEAAVNSVLDGQDGVDVRVLIIDDASPDDSAEVARRISARDPRVEVLVHTSNRGNIATYNEGLLEWADGDYCLLMSADDRATPGALRRAADLLDAHPGVGFVYGSVIWAVDGTTPPAPRTSVRGWSTWSGRWWIEQRFRQAENPIKSPEIVVRTSLQQAVGGYDADLPQAADMEMYMRLAAHADVGFIRGADQAYYRIHGSNMSGGVSSLMDLRQRREVFALVLERYGGSMGDSSDLEAVVSRQLAKEAVWAAARVHRRGAVRRSALGRRLLGAGPDEPVQDVEELLDFAQCCWPEVKRLGIYERLQGAADLDARDVAFMLRQKGEWWLRRRSWKYRGY